MLLLILFFDLKIFRKKAKAATCAKLYQCGMVLFVRTALTSHPLVEAVAGDSALGADFERGDTSVLQEGKCFHVLTVTHRNRLRNPFGNPL